MCTNISCCIFLLFFVVIAFEVSANFPATADEVKICEDNSNGRDVTAAMKARPLTCNVVCNYSDGSSEICKSPDGQLCIDIGMVPTGRCRDGECPVGLTS